MKSNIQKGLISTIIPVYNRPHMIEEAVESVLQQTYRPIEIIIVDDGSTDNTLEVLQKLAKQNKEIAVVTQKNAGPGVAREAGRQIARGEYIQYLDSDDLLLADKFQLQVDGLKQNPDCDIAYGKECQVYMGCKPSWQPSRRTGERFTQMFPTLLMTTLWGTSIPLFRRRLTNKVGSWLALSAEEDWEYDARAASYNPKLYYCNEFVALQRLHDGHLSAGGGIEPLKLADRAIAREKIYASALQAKVPHHCNEMQYFSKYVFLLSRQCAMAGLTESAKNLFQLAVKSNNGLNLKHKFYRFMTLLLGWKNSARCTTLLE